AHVELVAVRLGLLEESLDTGETRVALGDERAHPLGKGLPGRIGIHLVSPRRLHQLTLVPLARRVGPRLDGALREALTRVGDDAGLVVLQEVAEALALGTGAERMVEREEERLGPLEGGAAAAAAEVLGEDARGPVEHLDLYLPAALPQGRLDGLGAPRPVGGLEHGAVE